MKKNLCILIAEGKEEKNGTVKVTLEKKELTDQGRVLNSFIKQLKEE